MQKYWKDREVKHAKAMLKKEKEITKEIDKLYRSTSNEIEKEVGFLLDKYADDKNLTLAQAKQMADRIDIRNYEEKAKRYVKDRIFSKKANKEMKKYNLKMRMSRMNLIKSIVGTELTVMTESVEPIVHKAITDTIKNEVKRQSGILGKNIHINKKQIEYIAKRRFQGSDFSVTLWRNKNKLHSELDRLLTRQLIMGENPRKIARELRKEVGSKVYTSERLMRTESARVQTEAQMMSYKELEMKHFMFISTEDDRVCDICEPLDGEIIRVSDGEVGVNIPPLHANCRCSTTPYVERE